MRASHPQTACGLFLPSCDTQPFSPFPPSTLHQLRSVFNYMQCASLPLPHQLRPVFQLPLMRSLCPRPSTACNLFSTNCDARPFPPPNICGLFSTSCGLFFNHLQCTALPPPAPVYFQPPATRFQQPPNQLRSVFNHLPCALPSTPLYL